MSKTSFADVDSEIPTAPASHAPAVTQETSVVDASFFDNSSGFDGEIDRGDIRLPGLDLAHGVGGLAKNGFLPGSIVFNREVTIATPTKGVMEPSAGANITILAGFKEFMSKVSNDEFNAGVKSVHYKTESEARAAGLITGKEARASGDEEARTFYPVIQAKVLVKGKPEFGFAFEFEGNSYAIAALTLGKASYWGAGITLTSFANEARMLKKPNYWASFQLFTKLDAIPGSPNSVWSFKAQRAPGKHSDSFIAWVKDLGI